MQTIHHTTSQYRLFKPVLALHTPINDMSFIHPVLVCSKPSILSTAVFAAFGFAVVMWFSPAVYAQAPVLAQASAPIQAVQDVTKNNVMPNNVAKTTTSAAPQKTVKHNKTYANTDSTTSAGILTTKDDASTSEAISSQLYAYYQGAVAHDPNANLSAQQAEQAQALAQQAKALYRPHINAQASAGFGGQSMQMQGAQFAMPAANGLPSMSSNQVSFKSDVNKGLVSQWQLGLYQPLYNPQIAASAKQLKLASAQTNSQAQAQNQQFIYQVAEQYTQLSLLQKTVNLLKNQQAAANRAAQEAQFRFNIGDSPKTGVHEAEAARLLIQSELLANQSQLAVMTAQSLARTGVNLQQVQLPTQQQLTALLQQSQVEPQFEDYWQAVLAQNPQLNMAALNINQAQQALQKNSITSQISLDLVGQLAQNKADGHYFGGNDATMQQNQKMIGLQLTLPLYTGGMTSAQYAENKSKLKQAQSQYNAAQLNMQQQAQQTWLGLKVETQRQQALSQAVLASQNRLNATYIGKQVGDKTVLDVLNAENDYTQTQLKLEQSKANLLLNILRYHMLKNTLTAQFLLNL